MIVTLAQARGQLQSTHSADDDTLTLMINAASEAVLTYLRLADEADIPTGATFAAQQATLILVAEFYKSREAEQDGAVGMEFGYGYLPRPVVALLYPHRDPALS
jgi:hypothetical protein